MRANCRIFRNVRYTTTNPQPSYLSVIRARRNGTLAGNFAMRKTIGFALVAALAAVAVAQTTSGNLLSDFGKTLNDAKTVTSTFTAQTIGAGSDEYSIALKKPNLARIDTPAELIVADGKTVTVLSKAENTYSKHAQAEGEEFGL